jgi:hypothetical protein
LGIELAVVSRLFHAQPFQHHQSCTQGRPEAFQPAT